MGLTGTTASRGLKEVVEKGDMKGKGLWNAGAKKREKLVPNSSIEVSRFGCLDPVFSLKPNSAMM